MKQELRDIKKRFDQGYSPTLELKVPGEDIIYRRKFQNPVRLIILGGGHVSQSLCRFAADLEFEVVIVDDRQAFANSEIFPKASRIICDSFGNALRQIQIREEDYIAIVTRGHKHDADCLRMILDDANVMPAYLGLIGSRRRVRLLFEQLQEEGYQKAKMDQIHSPIGLPIDAVTPDEIGISILAELIQCRRAILKAQAGILEQKNADMRLLNFLEQPEEKILTVVIESTGSTPVKTGAIMAVDALGEIYGTVGGGCGEHEVIQNAIRMFQTRQDSTMVVDMTNDQVMDEGMVCGGTMKVALYYIEAFE